MSDEIDENETIEEEEENEFIELVDEEGKKVNFKLLDVTEYKGKKYVLLLVAEPNENIADDEVLIFELDEKSESLKSVDDDALLEEVFEFYKKEAEEFDDYDN